MKRKKSSVDVLPEKTNMQTPVKSTKLQKANKDISEVLDIKKKISKVNLYLSLLNKSLFTTVAIDEVEVASEIEQEVNDFLISKAKAIFTGSTSIDGFSNAELGFLKLLSRKGTEPKVAQTEAATIQPEPVLPPVSKPTPVQVSPDKMNKRSVSVIDENGKQKEVVVETGKLVLPPPAVKRHAPASFEQQMQMAARDTGHMQKAFQELSGPLVVDSTDY